MYCCTSGLAGPGDFQVLRAVTITVEECTVVRILIRFIANPIPIDSYYRQYTASDLTTCENF